MGDVVSQEMEKRAMMYAVRLLTKDITVYAVPEEFYPHIIIALMNALAARS